jgi:hypothetical protein
MQERYGVDIRRIHDIRCAVYFEKKSLKSALVKPENLWVAFELPDEK